MGKIGFFADNGLGKWHLNIFKYVENIEFFLPDRNKHNIDCKKVFLLKNKKNILLGLKNPLNAYKRLKYNNFDKKLDFHYFELEELIKNNYLDYVIVKSDRSLYTLASLKEKYNNFKLIYWFASVLPFQDIFDKRSFFIRKYAFDKIDRFIAITNQAKKTLMFERINKEKICQIYPGIIDTEVFYPIEKKIAKEKVNFKTKYNLLYVGKITSWKGVFTLIYALKLLENYNIHLHIIGSGAQKENLSILIDELNLNDKVSFYGFIEYKKLNYFYNASDIFILPSLPGINVLEQFGFVVAEAMAAGIPPIVSNIGGLKEVVQYNKDLLFTLSDYEELAEKIKNLLNNQELYARISKNVREIALQNYESKNNAKKIEECLKKIF
jgi:glycosyltransferase involved in cell wall biosynthesis